MVATFTYTPSKDFQKQNQARVLSAQFGEGYSQRISEGLNTLSNNWTLNFINQPIDTANAIDQFLATAGTGDPTEAGKAYFYWTPPGETVTYRVICPNWSMTSTSHISATITATFIRVYDN